MKVLAFILFSTVLLASCDQPMRTRFQETPAGIDNNLDGVAGEGEGTTGTNGSGGETSSEDGIDESQNTDPITTVPGFSNCSLSMQFYGGPAIGYLGLCQSDQNESVFKLKMAESDPTVGTCFVPVHILGQNSFKLGIAECVHNVADKVYDMILTKERPEPINGVMVIKAGSAVQNYMYCMNAKVDFMYGFPPGTYVDQQCVTQAQGNPDAYAFCVCTKFKGAFSSFYKQIPLPQN